MLEHAREEAEPKMRRLEGEGRNPRKQKRNYATGSPCFKSHVALSKPQLGVSRS